MRDSRSVGGFGNAMGSALQPAGGLSAERLSSFFIVSAWVSTSLRSLLNFGSHVHVGNLYHLASNARFGFLPVIPRKTGEEKVNVKNCSEVKGRT